MNITDIARECGIGDSHGYFIANYAKQIERFADAIKAAHLAELAGVEMPEPVGYYSATGHGKYYREFVTTQLAEMQHGEQKVWQPVVTLEQCREAVASAVAKERSKWKTYLLNNFGLEAE